ncbi:hypothetical protein BGW80DRAFT_1558439, partial [Lactifluus volemus]
MAAGKQNISAASYPSPPVATTMSESHGKKNKKKKRASAKPRPDDVDALAPSETLDFGTLPAPDEGLAEAIAAVLEAPRAAANGGGGVGNNFGVAGTDPTAAAQAELLATANELYQRMDAGGGGLRPDGAYWAALPAHIRNFAQAMYAIAQQMVQTGEQGEGRVSGQVVAGDGSEREAGGVVAGWQGDMSLPVDPSFFADAAFTAALEQQGEENGIIGVGVGVAEVTKSEGGEEEERSQSRSEPSDSEEAEGEPGRDTKSGEDTGRSRGRRRRTGTGDGVGSRDREIPTSDRKLLTSSVVSDLLPKAEAAAVAAAAAARAAAKKAKVASLNMPSQTRQPSSRAQGKQPMNYFPHPTSATATTTTTTTTSTTTTSTTTTNQQKTNTSSPTTRSTGQLQKHPSNLNLILTHILITIHRHPLQILHKPRNTDRRQ